MPSSYLSKSFFIYLIIVALILFNFASFYLTLIFFGIVSLIIILFRRKGSIDVDIKDSNRTLLYSPIHGEVVSVQEHEDAWDIILKQNYFSEWGLRMPMKGKISLVEKSLGRRLVRFFISRKFYQKQRKFFHYSLLLEVGDNVNFSLNIYPCYTSLRPVLWVIPGDKGKTGGVLGFFPLGGILHLDLPKQYFEILARPGDEVKSGETPLAGIKLG